MNTKARQAAVLAAAAGSMAAAGLHLAILPFGAEGLRYFGADKQLVDLAEEGSWVPVVVAVGIAASLTVAASYAYAQAGRARRLPWQRPIYGAITAVYLLRGVAIAPQVVLPVFGVDTGATREIVFSGVALALGLLHVPGIGRLVVRSQGAPA